MPNGDDAIYFERRAKQEREIASKCQDRAVALTHLNLADAYERRLAGEHVTMIGAER